MYVSVLDKFLELGVEMMPRLEVIPDSASTIHALTSGIHSAEALDMVKDHVRTLLGPAEFVPPSTKLQLSKLQAAQVPARPSFRPSPCQPDAGTSPRWWFTVHFSVRSCGLKAA